MRHEDAHLNDCLSLFALWMNVGDVAGVNAKFLPGEWLKT